MDNVSIISTANVIMQRPIVCHICYRFYERNELRCIFDKEGLNGKLAEKICKYTPFPVNSKTHSLALICTTCADNINNWDNYVQSCVDAHCTVGPDNLMKSEEVHLQRFSIHASETQSSTVFNQHLTNTKEIHSNALQNNVIGVRKCRDKSRNTYCIAKWCNNNNGQCNISFFRIPKDKQRSEQWLINAGRHDLLNKDVKIIHSKYLCEKHFSETMFMNGTHQRLVWNAVPSIFLDTRTSLGFTARKDECWGSTKTTGHNLHSHPFPISSLFISSDQMKG